MGLLDYGFEDPNTAGLLSLGLRLMSTPGKFGTALGQAGLGAMGDMQRARAQQQDRQQAAQRQQLFELQMKQAQQAQADADGRRSLAQQSAMSPGAMAVSMNGGPTPAAASALPMTSPGFDYRRYSQGLAAMGDVGGAMAIEQALRKEQSKLKSVEPMRDPGTGKMVNVALYEDGTTKVLPFGVKPEIALQQLGDRVVAVDKNALPSGMSFTMGQSPDSRASNNVTMRGQNMTAGTAAQRLAFDRESSGGFEYKDDGNGNFFALPKKPTGPGAIQPVPVNMPNKNVKASTDALAIIEQAKKLIPEATGSYAGAGFDQAARVIGSTTGGDKAAAQLKVLQAQLMLKQPRMEGPQSDKDVQLYREAAGQIGDPTVPAEIKMAALETIQQMHERYAGVNTSPPWLNKSLGDVTPALDIHAQADAILKGPNNGKR